MKNYRMMDYTSIRYPILPLDTYEKQNCIKNADYLSNFTKKEQNILKSGILLSSKSLHDCSKNLKYEKKNKINTSIMKYVNRSITRSTPFGLHAASSFSNINFTQENVTQILRNNNYKFYFYIDFVWLNELINEIELNTEILPYLKVKVNPLIYTENNILYNFLSSKQYNKINVNDLLKYVMDLSKNFIVFKDLFNKVKTLLNNDIPQIEIYKWLIELLNRKILITELSMFPNDSTYLNYILKILEKNEGAKVYFNKLTNIEIIIKKIQEKRIDELYPYLEYLIEKMSKLHKSNSYVCGITNDQSTKLYLSEQHKNEIEELIELLTNISYYCYSNSKLIKYKNKFLEKYGYYREVSIKDLINKNTGLGWPDYFYDENNDIYENKNTLRFKSILLELLYEMTDKEEIDLNNLKIKKFFESQDKKDIFKIANSFELDFISSNTSKKLYLAPSTGSMQIGKYAGRFTPSFNKKQKEYYKKMCDELINHYKKRGIDLVDLKFPFENKKINNITINDFSTNMICAPLENITNQILLENIVVGINKDNMFYFKDKKSNSIIKFVTFNALNPNSDDKLFRFLLELTAEDVPLYGISTLYREFILMDKIPRIVYKNIVLYPKTYKLHSKDYCNVQELKKYLISILNDYYFYLKTGDNRLLLNTNNEDHIIFLFEFLRKRKQITITEVEDDVLNAIYKKNKDGINEFTLSFLNTNQTISSNVLTNKSEIIKFNERNKTVFSNWLYLKIYIDNNYQSEILKRYILPIFNKYGSNNPNIKKMFYILYKDIDNHIRLRIECTDKYKFLNEICDYFSNLLEKKVVSNIILDNYEREIERYGGIYAIDNAENYFMYDSILALKLLECDLSKTDLIIYTALLILSTLKSFGFDFYQSINIFNTIDKNEFRNDYIKNRKKIRSIIEKKEMDSIFNYLDDILIKRHESILLYNSSIKNENKINILTSCMHMLCNRIYGIEKNKEKMTYAFARHILHDYEYRYRNNI